MTGWRSKLVPMEKPRMPMEILEFFKEQGRKGGKIGGPKRMKALTAAEKRELGRKAGLASGKARAKKAKARKGKA